MVKNVMLHEVLESRIVAVYSILDDDDGGRFIELGGDEECQESQDYAPPRHTYVIISKYGTEYLQYTSRVRSRASNVSRRQPPGIAATLLAAWQEIQKVVRFALHKCVTRM